MSDKNILTPRQQQIIRQFSIDEWFSAGVLAEKFPNVSAATLRRDVAELVDHGMLEKQGENKGVKYAVTERSRLFVPFSLGTYYKQDVEDRVAQISYNFATFAAMGAVSLFTPQQDTALKQTTQLFENNARGLSSTLYQKEPRNEVLLN